MKIDYHPMKGVVLSFSPAEIEVAIVLLSVAIEMSTNEEFIMYAQRYIMEMLQDEDTETQ
jgi:hypothetical protein